MQDIASLGSFCDTMIWHLMLDFEYQLHRLILVIRFPTILVATLHLATLLEDGAIFGQGGTLA